MLILYNSIEEGLSIKKEMTPMYLQSIAKIKKKFLKTHYLDSLFA